MLDKLFRSLPNFKGKNRLANWVLPKVKYEVMIKTRYGLMYLPNTIDNQYFEIFYNGEYEKGLVDYVCKSLPKDGVILDVGANIGSIAVPVALRRPDLMIYCFEGLTRNFNFLERNIKLNDLSNVFVFNLVLSKVEGDEIKFYYDEMFRGNSSIHNLYSNSYELHHTRTLDSVIKGLKLDRLDFVKIDTEGSESLIIKGAKEVLLKFKPDIHFEYNCDYEIACGLEAGDSQRELLSLGYKLYNSSICSFSGKDELTGILHGGGDLIAKIID